MSEAYAMIQECLLLYTGLVGTLSGLLVNSGPRDTLFVYPVSSVGIFQGQLWILFIDAIPYLLWEAEVDPLFPFQWVWTQRQGYPVEPWQGAICGAGAGGISAAITTPLDVAKTRIMLARVKKETWHVCCSLLTC